MLLDNLYTTRMLETGPDGTVIRAVIMLNSMHPVFKGHFPGNPILPGVCTVQIIKEVMEAAFGKPLVIRSAGSIKYLGFVNPAAMPELEFHLHLNYSEDRSIVCAATVSAQGTSVCSFKGTFLTCP